MLAMFLVFFPTYTIIYSVDIGYGSQKNKSVVVWREWYMDRDGYLNISPIISLHFRTKIKIMLSHFLFDISD